MKSIAKYGTTILFVALAAAWCGWNDAWYLTVGLITAGLPLALIAIWTCFRRQGDKEKTIDEMSTCGSDEQATFREDTSSEIDATPTGDFAGFRESLVIGTFQGVVLGIGLNVYLMTVFTLLQQVPWLYDRYYDADRTTLEAKLSTLEEAGNYGDAVDTIEGRLKRKTGRAWRRILSERLYGDLVQHARHLPATESLPLLTKASGLATDYEFDAMAASTLREQATREANLAARIDDLRHQEDWIAIVDVLKSELLRDDNSGSTALQLYNALCTAAVRSTSPDEQAELYTQAVALAIRYSLSVDPAQAALSQLRLAQEDQTHQGTQLAELHREAAEIRRQLIEEMIVGAAEISSAEARLLTLRRIATLGEQHGVQLPAIRQQIVELDEAIVRQRKLLEQIEHLRGEQRHDQVMTLLVSAVRTTDRRQWIRPLDTELIDCLGEWCDAAGGSVEVERTRLHRALAVANDCGLEAPVLRQRLAVTEARLADRDRIRGKIAELNHERRFGDLVDYLKVRIEERSESDWALPYGHELHRALFRAALESDDLAQRAALLRKAVAFASKYKLQSAKEAKSHLADTEQRIWELAEEERRRVTPSELPPGTNGGIGRVTTFAMPFVSVDVWVEDADGAPLTGLQSKDFAVTVGDRKVPFAMRPVSVDSVSGRFAIVVDTSGSASPALPIVKTGIRALAEQLAQVKGAQLKLIPFNAEVNATLRWTADAATISAPVQTLKAEGGIALHRALFAAVEELSRQPAPCRRYIVLFTDGKDSVGGVSLDDVMLQCRAKDITIFAIGLQTAELEPKVLNRITADTGGQYLEAANTTELGALFLQTSRSIRRQHYRLVLDLGDSEQVDELGVLSVSIGRGLRVALPAQWTPRSDVTAVNATSTQQ